jgi:hypothetical protein
LNDVFEMLYASPERLDWALIFSRAREYEWTIPLRESLRVLWQEWAAPLDARAQAWVTQVEPPAREFAQAARMRDRASVGRRFWTDLEDLPTWSQRARFAVSNLFPAPNYMRRRYTTSNPVTLLLAYPYRWWRGVKSFRDE